MSIALEGVQQQTVPMSYDSSVRWNVETIPSHNGKLYKSPNCSDEMAETALRLANTLRPDIMLPAIGSGTYATVYARHGVAYKRFKSEQFESDAGLSAVKINIALGLGLQAIGELKAPTSQGAVEVYTYAAPEYLGCFIPDDLENSEQERAIWMMSHERGRTALVADLPPESKRLEHFAVALQTAGLSPNDAFYDDSLPKNTLVQDYSSEGGSGHTLIKLDMMANRLIEFAV